MRSFINKLNLLGVGVVWVLDVFVKSGVKLLPCLSWSRSLGACSHAGFPLHGNQPCWFLSLLLQDTAEGELECCSRVSRLILRDGAEGLCVFPRMASPHMYGCVTACFPQETGPGANSLA